MSTTDSRDGLIDVPVFEANRAKFPAEQLVSYWGKQVAWSADGTRILASADTHDGIYGRLKELGIHPSTVVFGYVDDPNEVQF